MRGLVRELKKTSVEADSYLNKKESKLVKNNMVVKIARAHFSKTDVSKISVIKKCLVCKDINSKRTKTSLVNVKKKGPDVTYLARLKSNYIIQCKTFFSS